VSDAANDKRGACAADDEVVTFEEAEEDTDDADAALSWEELSPSGGGISGNKVSIRLRASGEGT
jgi:hypothetical protein